MKETISFIAHVEQVLFELNKLAERANKEQSQFRFTINGAKLDIQNISQTIHEVLRHDLESDYPYTPPKTQEKN